MQEVRNMFRRLSSTVRKNYLDIAVVVAVVMLVVVLHKRRTVISDIGDEDDYLFAAGLVFATVILVMLGRRSKLI